MVRSPPIFDLSLLVHLFLSRATKIGNVSARETSIDSDWEKFVGAAARPYPV